MNAEVPFVFKLARPEHLDVVVALMRSLEREDPNKKPFDDQMRRSSYARFLNEPGHGYLWLFESGEKVVGYMVLAFVFSFEYGGRNAFIDELYVIPEYRRKGIGSRALQFARQTAQARGVVALHLEVSRNNSLAHKLYLRAGFVDHDRYLLTKWLEPE